MALMGRLSVFPRVTLSVFAIGAAWGALLACSDSSGNAETPELECGDQYVRAPTGCVSCAEAGAGLASKAYAAIEASKECELDADCTLQPLAIEPCWYACMEAIARARVEELEARLVEIAREVGKAGGCCSVPTPACRPYPEARCVNGMCKNVYD
jgi:hypothetical protein